MGRLFTKAAADGLQFKPTPVDSAGQGSMAMHALFSTDDILTGHQTVLSIEQDDNDDIIEHQSIWLLITTGYLQAYSREDAAQGFVSTNPEAASLNVWSAVTMWLNATDDRNIVFDGGTVFNDTVDITVATLDVVNIGMRNRFSAGAGRDITFSGTISECSIWTSPLAEAEAASLSAGAWPPYVNSANIGFFTVLGNTTEKDVVGGATVSTTYGTPIAVGHKNLRPWPGQQQ